MELDFCWYYLVNLKLTLHQQGKQAIVVSLNLQKVKGKLRERCHLSSNPFLCQSTFTFINLYITQLHRNLEFTENKSLIECSVPLVILDKNEFRKQLSVYYQ